MAINEKYRDGFIAQVQASMKGEVTHIPNPLGKRVDAVFKLMPARYCLIQAGTGMGKTSLADFLYVLSPYDYFRGVDDIHWECIYFSLERKEKFKHAKWLSWFMKKEHELQIPADDLMGFGEHPVNEKGYEFIRTYDETMSDLLSHIHMYDGKINSKFIEGILQRRAYDLGIYFYSDDKFLYCSDKTVYVEAFVDKNLVEVTKAGNRPYIEYEYKGSMYKIYQNDHKYFLHNPRTFVFIVVDGINLLGDKDKMDAISKVLATSRDRFDFSPVVVNQQNRAMGDIQRLKLHKQDMGPQIGDGFKSSQMGFDADLIIGLFDPLEYKALNNRGEFLGYSIKADPPNPSMLHPKGFSRFRSMHMLKNNFGIAGGVFGLRFTGESNHFELLPKPDDPELIDIYSEIREGK